MNECEGNPDTCPHDGCFWCEYEWEVVGGGLGYVITRDGQPYTTIPWDDVRIYVDDRTLVSALLDGVYNVPIV